MYEYSAKKTAAVWEEDKPEVFQVRCGQRLSLIKIQTGIPSKGDTKALRIRGRVYTQG